MLSSIFFSSANKGPFNAVVRCGTILIITLTILVALILAQLEAKRRFISCLADDLDVKKADITVRFLVTTHTKLITYGKHVHHVQQYLSLHVQLPRLHVIQQSHQPV